MILHNLISIENRRIELLSQGYEFIADKLEQIKLQYNIADFDSWDKWELNNLNSSEYNEQCFYIERYIYSLFTAKNTVDKILAGSPITDILFADIMTVPECLFQLDDWYKQAAIEKLPLWGLEDVEDVYNLDIIFWILNSTPFSYHTPILDRVIWELQLLDSGAATNQQCVLEYLQRYRELIQSHPEQTLQIHPQEQIYSIQTNLTKKQLVALLGRLKDNGFIALEQTEEDFLNAFNPNATKQGKIKWIKRSGSRTDKPVCKTAIVDFIYRIICDNIKEVELIHNVEVIFGITINKSTVSDVSRRNAKKASEYSEVFADIFAEIANL